MITAENKDAKNEDVNFWEEEIFPIKSIQYADELKTGAYGTTIIELETGESKYINFEGIEAAF